MLLSKVRERDIIGNTMLKNHDRGGAEVRELQRSNDQRGGSMALDVLGLAKEFVKAHRQQITRFSPSSASKKILSEMKP